MRVPAPYDRQRRRRAARAVSGRQCAAVRPVHVGPEGHIVPHLNRNAPSTLRAQFRWSGPDDHVDMSLADACMTLEHWVDWK